MIKQLKTILGRYVKKKKIVTEIPERAITNETDNYDISVRKYKNIPLYTEEEMEKAPIDDSDEVRYECLGRQVINGYVGLYNIPITVDTRISVVPTFRTPSPFVSLFINTPLSNTFFLDTLFQM